MSQLVSRRLKELFPDGFWLYVDDSAKSTEAVKEMELFFQAGMVTIYNIYKDGGFKGSDVPLPFLRRNGDVMTGSTFHEFIEHLKKLNEEFVLEEREQLKMKGSKTPSFFLSYEEA